MIQAETFRNAGGRKNSPVDMEWGGESGTPPLRVLPEGVGGSEVARARSHSEKNPRRCKLVYRVYRIPPPALPRRCSADILPAVYNKPAFPVRKDCPPDWFHDSSGGFRRSDI